LKNRETHGNMMKNRETTMKHDEKWSRKTMRNDEK
jgi:hypothetical protein